MEEQKDKTNKQPNHEDSDAEKNKSITLMSYFFLLCLVPLLTKKNSKFAYFHAKQGLVLCIAWFFTWVPYVGTVLGILLGVLSVMGIINVINGKMEKLPLIGDLAEKFNI